MMKKIIALAICLLFLVSLTSCSSITKFEKCHPSQQQMTKWVGDCEELSIELYICDDDDLMVIDYGEKKTTYYVWWHQNYLTQMSVRDMEAVSSGVQEHHSAIGFWDVELVNETCFKLTNGQTTSLPTEITMMRVQTELSEEEIPLP